MKKNLNKLATLALTGILMTGMSFGVLAEEVQAQKGVFDGSNGTVTLEKKINVGELTDSAAMADVPTAKYTYTIAPGVAGTAVGKQNGQDVTLQVEAGNMDAVVGEAAKEANFGPSDQVVFGKTGNYAAVKEVTFSFNASAFGHAGVFRYVITETADGSNPTTITKPDGYNTARVLDVWVTNGENGLEVSNFTLYKKEGTETYNAEKKSWGWTDGGNNYTGEDASNVDAENFKTTDLKVEKQITGSLANKSATFDFTVKLETKTVDEKTNNYNGMEITVVKPDGTTEKAEVSGNEVNVSGIALGNGKTITIYGLPSDVKYTISEVDATKNHYEASAKTTTFSANDIESQTKVDLVKGGADANGNVTNTLTVDDAIAAAGKYVQVTNTLNETTPTGVVMNIAPYAAMILGAGAFAGVFLGRKKSEDEE